jgi:hypothetical protein
VALTVQMSPDGIVREVYLIDESDNQLRPGFGFGLGLGLGF